MKRRMNKTIVFFTLLYFSLFAVVLVLPFHAKKMGDGDFHQETKRLASFLSGQGAYQVVAITKAPGPVLFNVVPYLLAGADASDHVLWIACVIWTGLFLIVTFIVTLEVIRSLYNEATAIGYGLLTLLLPIQIYYSLGILAESLAYLGVSWILLGFLLRSHKKKFYVLTVLGMVALILARPNAGLVIPFLIVVGVVLYWRYRDMAGWQYIRAALTSLAIIIVISIGVKLLPNKIKTLKQEQYMGHVLVHGRFQFRDETFNWSFWDDRFREGSVDYEQWKETLVVLQGEIAQGQSFTEVYYRWFFEDVMHNPLVFLKQFLVRLVYGNTLQIGSAPPEKFELMSFSGQSVFWVLHGFINLFNAVILILAIAALSAKKQLAQHWPLAAVIAGLWIFSALVYMEQRYLFPSRPLLIFLAIVTVSRMGWFQNLSLRYFRKGR